MPNERPKSVAEILAMPLEELAVWASSVPDKVPFSTFALATDAGRKGFLEEYFAWGEESLFEAVSHLWNSLNEPRGWSCATIAAAAATGGYGKKALINVLRVALREALDSGITMPAPAQYDSLDEWHEAALRSMSEDHLHFEATIQKYADLLNGRPPGLTPDGPKVLLGPW